MSNGTISTFFRSTLSAIKTRAEYTELKNHFNTVFGQFAGNPLNEAKLEHLSALLIGAKTPQVINSALDEPMPLEAYLELLESEARNIIQGITLLHRFDNDLQFFVPLLTFGVKTDEGKEECSVGIYFSLMLGGDTELWLSTETALYQHKEDSLTTLSMLPFARHEDETYAEEMAESKFKYMSANIVYTKMTEGACCNTALICDGTPSNQYDFIQQMTFMLSNKITEHCALITGRRGDIIFSEMAHPTRDNASMVVRIA